jgi:preprotein translocase subunit Sec61beta
LEKLVSIFKKGDDTVKIKEIMPVFYIALAVIIVVLIINSFLPLEPKVDDSYPESRTSESKVLESEIDISYDVAKIEDLSYSNIRRYQISVVVKNQPTTEQLKLVARAIVNDFQESDQDFNALSIQFYDYEEYVGFGNTLGYVEFAPEGEWRKADEVRTGDYNKMEYMFALKEKDWSKQLTEEEVKIFKQWKEIRQKQPNLSEEEINQQVAEDNGLSPEEVKNIMFKQAIWAHDDQK